MPRFWLIGPFSNNPDIVAGTFYTKFMIEENDTMDEVAKAGSSTGKT